MFGISSSTRTIPSLVQCSHAASANKVFAAESLCCRSILRCECREINADLSLINVSNLQTKIGLVKEATIRMEDIMKICIL